MEHTLSPSSIKQQFPSFFLYLQSSLFLRSVFIRSWRKEEFGSKVMVRIFLLYSLLNSFLLFITKETANSLPSLLVRQNTPQELTTVSVHVTLSVTVTVLRINKKDRPVRAKTGFPDVRQERRRSYH